MFAAIPPIALTPNAKLFFKEYDGTFTEDPLLGNETANFTLISLDAVITFDSEERKFTRDVGLKVEMVGCRGYILSPVPLGIDVSGTADCQLTLAGQVRNGEFDFTPLLTPFGKEITQTLGFPFRGTFRAQEGK